MQVVASAVLTLAEVLAEATGPVVRLAVLLVVVVPLTELMARH